MLTDLPYFCSFHDLQWRASTFFFFTVTVVMTLAWVTTQLCICHFVFFLSPKIAK